MVSGARMPRSLRHRGPGPKMSSVEMPALLTPAPSPLRLRSPDVPAGRKLRPGWPTASQSPTWVSWWAWRLCGKPPSSHGSSFDIRLHSTTDTGAEELGKTQLAGKWGSELLQPSPLPASPPLYLPHPGETGH